MRREYVSEDVLYHYLEVIEAWCFCSLNLVRESLDQIFIHNAIGGGEGSEDV